MIILILFILQAISASLSYDIELEGVMRLGDDFVRTLSQHSVFANKNPVSLAFKSRGKLPQKSPGEAVMRATVDSNDTKFEKEVIRHVKMTDPLQKYIDHLKKKGKKTLKYIGKLIKEHMNVTKDVTPYVRTVTDDYVSMMQNYYEYVTEGRNETFIDKEFLYLDIVETSCRLLYSEERKLLNDIISDQNVSVLAINEKIFKHSVNNKRVEMKYICVTYSICRQYPAFTDYCADLISEILKLPDKKFRELLEILTKIMKMNEVFLLSLVEKEDKELMIAKLQSLSTDLYSMKEFFAVLRAVITQRFKALVSNNEGLRMRTKAMRILLDIIDRTLESEEDFLGIDFDNSVSAIRYWSIGRRDSINEVLEEFAKHLFRLMEYNLTNLGIQEIRVLIEIIMRGSTTSEDVYKNVFKYGSNFIKGEDLKSQVDIL